MAKDIFQTSVRAALFCDTLVLIPCFNNPTYTLSMCEQLRKFGCRNIMLLDNASTSSAMIKAIDVLSSFVKVVRLPKNEGPHHFFENRDLYSSLPDVFFVSDPDLELNPDMTPDFMLILYQLTEHFKVGKAGLALRLDDRELMHSRKFTFQGQEYHPWEWEQKFWDRRIGSLPSGDVVYQADIDTTFSAYNKKYLRPDNFYRAIRVAGSFACRHLPWYIKNGISEEEAQEYRSSQKFSYHLT